MTTQYKPWPLALSRVIRHHNMRHTPKQNSPHLITYSNIRFRFSEHVTEHLSLHTPRHTHTFCLFYTAMCYHFGKKKRLADEESVPDRPLLKCVTFPSWEHENRFSTIAGSPCPASNHGSRCSGSPLPLTSQRPRAAPHSKEGPPQFLFILTELAWSSKGAIQQVIGLDSFARSREQPWYNPCSLPWNCRLRETLGTWIWKEARPILPLCLFIHRSNAYRTFCRCVCETDSLASIFFLLWSESTFPHF